MDKIFEVIKNKQWDDVSYADLKYLVYEKNYIKIQIANLFNVTKNQVSYKLKKFNISIQKKMLSDAFDMALKETKKAKIQDLIFASDKLLSENDESELLNWGPVKVTKGKFKGRIGCYDDDDGYGYGYVYWGDMVSSLDACSLINLDFLSNNITAYDLVKRLKELSNQIRMRCAQQFTSSETDYKTITKLYGEYVYAMGLLNNIYEETFYLDNTSNKKVFLSYSSKDKETALFLATDLKNAKYKVWFDVWDIEGGHSIPEEISKGIESSDALIMLVSKNYVESTFCKDEWQSFYMKYNKTKPNSIIPILIDESETPAILASRRYLKLTENNYNEVLKELKRALNKL